MLENSRSMLDSSVTQASTLLYKQRPFTASVVSLVSSDQKLARVINMPALRNSGRPHFRQLEGHQAWCWANSSLRIGPSRRAQRRSVVGRAPPAGQLARRGP